MNFVWESESLGKRIDGGSAWKMIRKPVFMCVRVREREREKERKK